MYHVGLRTFLLSNTDCSALAARSEDLILQSPMRRCGRVRIKGLYLFVQCSRVTGTSQFYIQVNSIDRKVVAA
jgi:hypothetical protein